MTHVHRLASHDEQALLREGFRKLEPLLVDYGDELRRRRYFHLYKQNHASDVLDEALGQRLTRFAAQLGQELLAANQLEAGDIATHFGYLVSFPGAPGQDWHIDYDGDLVVIYIPLTRETEKNATQYLKVHDGYCLSCQFINKSDAEVPILYTPRQSMHRGIDNAEWFRREVFYVYFSKPDWKNVTPLFESATKLAVNVDVEEEDRHWPEVAVKG